MMEKNSFTNDVAVLDEPVRSFLQTTHDTLQAAGYKLKKETVKSGVRYAFMDGDSNAIVKFTVSGPSILAHIFGRHIADYPDFIQTLPEAMLTQMKNGYPCKRSADPNACSPFYLGGFRFSLDETDYMKCKNFNFKFEVTNENINAISDFIEHERIQREAKI